MFLEISQNSQAACNFIKKETLAQVFSCELCEISKNTFSYRTPQVAPSFFSIASNQSDLSKKRLHWISVTESLTHLRSTILSYRNQEVDSHCKSNYWFLYNSKFLLKKIVWIHVVNLEGWKWHSWVDGLKFWSTMTEKGEVC